MIRRGILVTTALLLASCIKEKRPAPVIPVVRAGVVQLVQPMVSDRYSASIEANRKVDLAFKSGGIVQSILQVRGADGRMRNVETGDKVATGAPLAHVRPLDYEHAVEQSKAQSAEAQAQLAKARAQLAQARANFNTSEIEFTRASRLFQAASLVKPQYDQAKGRYESDAASVKAAEAAVNGAEHSVANAAAAERQAKLALSDTVVAAPFAGWITARNVDRGSLVGSSTIGFSLEDTHLVKAVFGVPDVALAGFHLGQKQPVNLDALNRSVPGVVTSISPQANPESRVFAIEVTVENQSEQVRPGMIASITVEHSRDSRPRLAVPLDAVVRAPANPNGFAVYRLIERDGKTYACAQTIEIGDTLDNSIEAKRGLMPGERIITVGAALVRDGQQVNVIP